MEKSRRKIEGDLRVSQEAVAELERNKAELAQSIQRKEREFSAIMAKIEDEASLGGKQQKQIKELTVSIFRWKKIIIKGAIVAIFGAKIQIIKNSMKIHIFGDFLHR